MFIIEKLLQNNTEKEKKQVLKDIKWFQDNYKDFYINDKKEREKGIYQTSPKDNYHTINHFENYLMRNKKQNWLKDIYSKIDIDSIIKELKLRYNIYYEQNNPEIT
jgi:hypothetical protein